jgi:hypothetical protein
MHTKTNQVTVPQPMIDKDMLLPIERPLRQALTIYAYRLLVVLGIALLNVVLFSLVTLVISNSVSTSDGTIQIPISTLVISMLMQFIIGLIIGLSLNRSRAMYRTLRNPPGVTHIEVEMQLQKALYL